MTINVPPAHLEPKRFPVLSRLKLSEEELVELTTHGSIRRVWKGRKTKFQLRYRVHGRQRARYIRACDAPALEVELALLQRRCRARRHLSALATIARQLLRDRKSVLAPVIEPQGYSFHGHKIRRRRNVK